MTVGDGVDNEEDNTESESDDPVSNDSRERESDKDCVVIGRKETVIVHEETGNTNCKHSVTPGTQTEGSSEKPKSTITTLGCELIFLD